MAVWRILWHEKVLPVKEFAEKELFDGDSSTMTLLSDLSADTAVIGRFDVNPNEEETKEEEPHVETHFGAMQTEITKQAKAVHEAVGSHNCSIALSSQELDTLLELVRKYGAMCRRWGGGSLPSVHCCQNF